jgi:thiamine biosynthesis lipoprotein
MTTAAQPMAFPALGTTAVLLVADPMAVGAARAVLDAELGAIDLACSRFRDDSELARLNRAGGATVEVSALLLEAVEVGLRAAELTDGSVDPTVGSAMRLLGYDRTFSHLVDDGSVPKFTVTPVPGWRTVAIDRRASTVRLPAGVELDLGATAKALCADRAARAVAKATGSGVLVSLGGDIAVTGDAPEGGWSVRVTENHAAGPDGPGQTVLVSSGGLATSSTTVRCWVRGDRRLHHLVDPATGQPAASCWRTASVAAGSCVDANIAATAAIVMGRAATAWLAARRLPARLVGADGRVVLAGAWPVDPAESAHPPC